MSRFRSSRPPSSPYITPEGRLRLEKELNFLWRIKRPQVTRSVSEAAAQGDRSENAEYIYGKKQLREIDRRVRFLRKRLDELITVDRLPDDRERVYFGAWVEVEDESGSLNTYRIVGPDEIDPSRGYISMDSPMARALLKKALDDEVVVEMPGRSGRFLVVNISYSMPE